MKCVLILFILFCIAGCSTSVDVEYSRAQTAIKNEKFPEAIETLDKIVKLTGPSVIGVKAAREAARICFEITKDFKKALLYYKQLVLYSSDETERIFAQKRIAQIYFLHLSNYKQAITENMRLLEMPHNLDEEVKYKLEIAKAYFYLGDYFQAETEANGLLLKAVDKDVRYQALLLKGNVSIARKESDKAIELFRKIISELPDQAKKENLPFNLALVYEERKDYKNAIEVLKEFKNSYSNPEYVEIRIKRLQKRLDNMPGAKGFRK